MLIVFFAIASTPVPVSNFEVTTKCFRRMDKGVTRERRQKGLFNIDPAKRPGD